MNIEERDLILGRIDERTQQLCKSMDNHLQHHEVFERQLEERLDKLSSRNLFTPIINAIKWLVKK